MVKLVKEENIIVIEKILIEILYVLESMPEVGNWRVERLRGMIQNIKDVRGWI